MYCHRVSRCEKALAKRNLVSKENLRPTGTLYSFTECFKRWRLLSECILNSGIWITYSPRSLNSSTSESPFWTDSSAINSKWRAEPSWYATGSGSGLVSVEHANNPRPSSFPPHPWDKANSFAFREVSLIEHFPTGFFTNAANVCRLANLCKVVMILPRGNLLQKLCNVLYNSWPSRNLSVTWVKPNNISSHRREKESANNSKASSVKLRHQDTSSREKHALQITILETTELNK